MRKLKLDLDALQVDSFAIGSGSGSGTVRARESTDQSYCGCETAPTGPACVAEGAWTFLPEVGTCNPYQGTCGRSANCSQYPCQSVNACHTDARPCQTVDSPCLPSQTCPGPESCNPGC